MPTRLPFRFEFWDSRPRPEPGRASAAEALVAASVESDKDFLAAFRKAVRLEPHDPDYYFILGEALAEVGRHADAVAPLVEAVRLNREDAGYRHALAATYWRLGRFAEAAESFRNVVRLEPDGLRGMTGLGAALTAAGQPGDAARVLRAGLRTHGDRAEVYRVFEAALWASGKPAEALTTLRKAIGLDPKQAWAHYDLGVALASSSQPEAALSSFDQALRLKPDEALVHLERGDTLYRLGREGEALSAYEKAVELEPGCLRDRPESLEARDAIRLRRLQKDMSEEASKSSGGRRALPSVSALSVALFSLAPLRSAWRAAFSLLLIAGIAHPTWTVGRAYVNYYLLKDQLSTIAGARVHEEDLRDPIRRAIRAHGLESYLSEEACAIETKPPWRRILCAYDQPVQILPGFPRTLRFKIEVERALPPQDQQESLP